MPESAASNFAKSQAGGSLFGVHPFWLLAAARLQSTGISLLEELADFPGVMEAVS
jgi:hypothetical protein